MMLSQHTTEQGACTTLSEMGGWVQDLIDLHARIAPRFARPEPRRRALAYLKGLISSTPRKNGWQIAEHAREGNPYGMQRLLGRAVWDVDGVRDDVRSYVVEQLAEQGAIGVIDESSFLKEGDKSAGVAVQYCGSTGEVQNCQVAVFVAYVSARGHALIDRELYLPAGWIEDPERCREAGIPQAVRFQTKPELAQRMLERIEDAAIAFDWVVADTVYGGNLELRTWLHAHGQAHVVAVPCNEPVGIQTAQGRQLVEVRQVEALLLTPHDWQRLSMSHGTKGPRIFDWAGVPILHRWHDDGQHWLLIRRCLDDPNKQAYYFVFGPPGTTLQQMVHAIGARWRVEEVFEAAKDLGLDQYEVRTWTAWYRHITLVMLAHAFLTSICAQAEVSAPSAMLLEAEKADDPGLTAGDPAGSLPPSPQAPATCTALIPLTVAEVAHLLGSLMWPAPCNVPLVLAWSHFRRHHSWLASFYHTKRRLEAG